MILVASNISNMFSKKEEQTPEVRRVDVYILLEKIISS